MSLEDLPTEFYAHLVDILSASVDYMLTILSGGVKGKNASFADMGIAVDTVVSDCGQESEDNVIISDQHSLVLACAWLNLKECCLIASKFIDGASEVVERAGQIMITVLEGTRHKGALEASALAIGQFSACLFSSTNLDLCSIPQNLLTKVLGLYFFCSSE